MENPFEGVIGKIDDIKKEVEERVIGSPLGNVLGGLMKGKTMQKVLHCEGYDVQTNREGGPVAITFDLGYDADNLTVAQATSQAQQVGKMVTELLPLFAAFSEGISPDELVEVATQLPALQGISPNLRRALLGLAQDLQKSLVDGKVSTGEAVTTFIAFAKTAVGL